MALGNYVGFIGRFTSDPELRTAGETSIVRFTLARNRPKRGDTPAEADFVDFTAFGKTAEMIERYFKKGDQLGIEAHIATSTYVASKLKNEDGESPKLKQTQLIVDRVEFIGGNKRNDSSDSADTASSNAANPSVDMGYDSDLPF